jgi:hypothetical protein
VNEHTILVAFTVEADDRTEAERRLSMMLPSAASTWRKPGTEALTSWWIAEDTRHDGSDLDSAVFVKPGAQRTAARVLHKHGLTYDYNVVGPEFSPGRFEAPEIETSAIFGDGWLVQIEYVTDADGKPVPDDATDLPRTLHGPFDSEEQAAQWIDAYPDGDTDVHDMTVINFNRVSPKEGK